MLPTLPRWFAHRGGGSLAPENTLAGIRLAARMGFRAVEFDVMLSADETPVLIHDETLERTTDGRGRVCDTPDARLFALDAGSGQRVPSFAEAARLCRELGLFANIEIKPAAGHERRTAEIVARLAAEWWRDAPQLALVSSFSTEALAIARELAPELARGALFVAPPADWPQILARLGAATLHCAAGQADEALLAEARERGVPVLCYTVNRPAEARKLFARGVAALFTDRLDRFAGEMDAYNCLHPEG